MRAAVTNKNWTIVFVGFLALSLAFSARAALGLMMPVWQAEFGWSTSYISGVGATALIVMAAVAPFAGRMVDTKGPGFALNLGMGLLGIGCAIVAAMSAKWMFIIGFAGFGAVGFGIVATHVVATAVTRSFDRNAGLATGIATSGATGGQFIVVPLIAALLAFASWRWSFGVLSMMSLAMIPCIRASLRPRAVSIEDGNGNAQDSMSADFVAIVRQPTFHILFWSFLICGFTTTGVIETHLLPFASFCGFPPVPSATAYLRVPYCVIPLGQRLMARDFERQVAKLQVRIAVLNGYAALGIPVTKAAAYVRPGKGKPRSSTNLCNRAA
ncbi:MFS transporter [Ruegeria aquimaris]|uniref:MFS transporter n=1 Tax=Ruegeria aquimaris TaxID=2984333 RepID=A0ABT3AE77_9RHOB|nr:MFS transporter [Ruegeria sp. XHP0148]MCV2886976.1 MFS transporter [Ruegeria sp. XHP0148]